MLSENQWADFEKLFPGAAAWMTARQLENEYERLRTERERLLARQRKFLLPDETKRLAWVESRFEELSAHFDKRKGGAA